MRKRHFFLNTIIGILKQFVTVVCGFVLPRYMLLYYGSETNGLVSTITNYLSFISLLDMGVGTVIQANLYKPLAEKNNEEISAIIKSSERFFRRLAYIFAIYILFLCFMHPFVFKGEFEKVFVVSLIVIIALSTFAQYLFGMTYQLLLNADQKSYVQLSLQIITILLNTVLSVIEMKLGADIRLVRLTTTIVYLLRPFGQALYVHKHYKIDETIKITGEPIKQKWNGFSQHLAAVVCQNVDVVALSLFSSLKNVSVYSVYFNVTNGVEQIIMTAATGVESLFGNMIANGENKRLIDAFEIIEWITHTIVTVIFVIAGITIVPFVEVYTKGINDANYFVPLFGYILVFAYGCQCIRVPYFRLIKAARHFKETQNGAFISAIINIIVTFALVYRYGLVGAASGTLLAMIYHTVYFVWYLHNHLIKRPYLFFIRAIVCDLIIVVGSMMACKKIVFIGLSYIDWIFFSLKISLIVIIISFFANIILYGKTMINRINNVKRAKNN